MILYFVPTYQHVCSVKIAETLWNHNILALKNIRLSNNVEENLAKLKEIENQICNDVENLGEKFKHMLPVNFKQLIKGYVRSLGNQFYMWKEYEYTKWKLDLPLPNELFWTSRGIQDRKKIAAALINTAKLDIVNSYKIACIYCLENYIPVIWQNIPIDLKTIFHYNLELRSIYESYEIALWTYYIFGNLKELEDMMKFDTLAWMTEFDRNKPFCPARIGFHKCLWQGNMSSAEYFFHRMSREDREELLFNKAYDVANWRFILFDDYIKLKIPREYYTEILCFLLSQMKASQLIDFLKRRKSLILKCFLDWPWQPLFVKMTNRIWDVLNLEDFQELLWHIEFKDIEGFRDYDYGTLFEEFWKSIVDEFKNIIRYGEFASDKTLVKVLKEARDDKYFRIVFKDACMMEKEKMIFQAGPKICIELACADKWDILKTFMLECISTKDQFIKLVTVCKNELYQNFDREFVRKNKAALDKFLHLVAEIGNEFEIKRSHYLATGK